MPTGMRIATFNVENLDDGPNAKVPLQQRASLMRPQLARIGADILCLQEVNSLTALDQLLATTPYATYNRAATSNDLNLNHGQPQNVVILSRWNIAEYRQIRHEFVDPPLYRILTATPKQTTATPLSWTRSVLYARIDLPGGQVLHVISFHLKSKLPFDIPGQKVSGSGGPFGKWRSASAWAEGAFISSMLRMGQALEVRMLVDTIFDSDPQALIVVCGDYNAETEEVPVEALRGDVENTDNPDLANRVLVPCEQTVPQSSRFSLLHRGKGTMIDHILISRSLLGLYHTTEIHNELLHDESTAFATDKKFPESDHAPIVSAFSLP